MILVFFFVFITVNYGSGSGLFHFFLAYNSNKHYSSGQSDYPRTPQDTPGHPRTLQDSIICMFNILYERVDDGLVLVCWRIN